MAPALQGSAYYAVQSPHGIDDDTLLNLKIQTVAADKYFLGL